MEHLEKAATITSSINVPSSPLIMIHKSPTNSCSSTRSSPKSPNHVVVSPCAACKILRRRCDDMCVLAPFFPPNEPYKFTIAHRVFGASNVIKFLQDLPETQRADAVSSMVYEANARIRDPVYGCAGAICHLQKQVSELQAQLAKSQAELVNMQCQQANLIALLCMERNGNGSNQDPISQEQQLQIEQQQLQQHHQDHHHQYLIDTTCFLDENNLGTCWEPLWT